MKFTIRKVDAKDPKIKAQLLAMQLETLPGDKPYDTDFGVWWIAYYNKTPAGYAGLAQSRQWSNAGYLCRAGVMPAFQGNGLQKRLIKARIRKAKHMGYEWLLCDTTENPRSSNSLISCGFRIYEPKKKWCQAKTAIYWRYKVKQF